MRGGYERGIIEFRTAPNGIEYCDVMVGPSIKMA
jgi:hypothetical protein